MKRQMFLILLAGVVIGIALSGLYKHFVTDRIMDKGGMENPFIERPLDGDYTYVDNSLLWPILEGTWSSEDGRWQAVIREESGVAFTLDGKTVLSTPLDFTYLQPGKARDTELRPEQNTLQTAEPWEIRDFYYCAAGEGEIGTLMLRLKLPENGDETVQFLKTAE